MLIETNQIECLLVIKPDVFEDQRGYFFESYNEEKFRQLGIDMKFLQDNESKSGKGVLRGLHFQVPPYEQGKLVRVIKGAVLDVAVDLRKSSPTYGQWASIELSEKNKWMYWIPVGFAHGYYVMSDWAEILYKTTDYYASQSERTLLWNDPALGIKRPIIPGKPPVLSEKDNLWKPLSKTELFD